MGAPEPTIEEQLADLGVPGDQPGFVPGRRPNPDDRPFALQFA
ncbi:MAG TPA: hypothetical protein VF933_37380 [Streptosporangiaceae bacterium]